MSRIRKGVVPFVASIFFLGVGMYPYTGADMKISRFLRAAFFILPAVLLTGYFRLHSLIPGFSFSRHALDIEPGPWAVSAALFYILVLGTWALSASLYARACGLSYKAGLWRDLPTFTPFLFLALAPLMLRHYLDRSDLAVRWSLLLAAVLAAVIYLKAVIAVEETRHRRTFFTAAVERALALPARRKAVALFLVSLAVYGAGALILIRRGIAFSGDEPHYLLVTQSLLADGDFDLANNYEKRDYTRYMIPQVVLRPHTVGGARPGSQVSFHSPGTSILLLPFYLLGSLFGGKGIALAVRLGMAAAGALLGIQLYLYALREWGKPRLAAGLWLVFAFTSPVFFYSIHVYPEIFIALAGLYVFRTLRFADKIGRGRAALLGLLLASFIWFHALKYLFILGPLFLYALWTLIRKRKAGAAGVWPFLAPFAALTAAYFAFQYAVYGSLNPTAVSWQGAMNARESVGFLKSVLSSVPFRFRYETLAGYFLDQRDGLLFYAPIYAFALLGAWEMIRRKGRAFVLLLFVTAPYVLVSAFLAQRTGYAPQARPLVAVSWGLAICVGYFLAHNAKAVFSIGWKLAVGWSLAAVALLLRYTLALYMETTGGTTERGGLLFYRLSNLHHSLTDWLPSYIKIEEWRWTPNFVWPAVLALALVAYLVVPRHEFKVRFGGHVAAAVIALAAFFIWFAYFPRPALYPPVPAALASGDKLTFYGLSRVALMREPARFDLLEDNRDYDFFFSAWSPAEKLEVEFGSTAGDYDLKLALFDEPVFEEETRRDVRTRTIEAPAAYRWNRGYLYRVSIRLDRRSDVRTGSNPYRFALRPAR